ncbi:MAG: acyl transferase [Bacteroidia bacterium]|nr:acyl transferase [Bacteroidia bacterium]
MIDINSIFAIRTASEFKVLAINVFKYQAQKNSVYKQYVESLKINPASVELIEQIPFLPVDFFKTHRIETLGHFANNSTVFSSSGTTGSSTSKHYVNDIAVYEKSYLNAFRLMYGDIRNYCVLALLPSYLEREGSSLVYMVDDLIKKSEQPQSGFFLNNYDELIMVLQQLADKKQKVLLIGVTYALLDLVEKFPLFKFPKNNLIVMETGGMKGKRKEMVREELHELLCGGFGINVIHSEYGMTELLSQAYSKGNGVFQTPPWMQILIRDTNDPFSYLPHGRTGGINVIDLANIHSCSFIATQDLGKVVSVEKNNPSTFFEVLGRFDNSDIRGCNLLVQ